MFHQLAGQLLDAHMIGQTCLWQQAPTPKKSISFGGNSEFLGYPIAKLTFVNFLHLA